MSTPRRRFARSGSFEDLKVPRDGGRNQAVHADRRQTGALEEAPVRRRASMMPIRLVADQAILCCERLEAGDSGESLRDSAEPRGEFFVRDVLERVDAEHEIEVALVDTLRECSKCTEADRAATAESFDHIGARVDSDVAYPGSEGDERGPPGSLSAAEIEDAAHGSGGDPLGRGDQVEGTPADLGLRNHAADRVAIPPVEVSSVIAFSHGFMI